MLKNVAQKGVIMKKSLNTVDSRLDTKNVLSYREEGRLDSRERRNSSLIEQLYIVFCILRCICVRKVSIESCNNNNHERII